MIPKEIFNLGVEFLSEHNDGWTRQRILERLKEIKTLELSIETKEYIDRILKVYQERKEVEKN